MRFSTKLIALTAGIFLVGCIFLTYIVSVSGIRILEGQVRDKLENQAVQAMDKIDRLFFERYADMKVLAGDPVISSKKSTQGQISARLAEYLSRYTFYSSLSFFDLKRTRIADTTGRNLGERHPFSDYWPEIAAGKDFVMTVADSRIGRGVVVYFASVVRDSAGKPFGVVASRMPVANVYEIAEQAVYGRLSAQKANVELLNREGLVLYSSYNIPGILKEKSEDWGSIEGLLLGGGKSGSIGHSWRGEEEISAFARQQGYRSFKGNDWVLVICTPAKEAFASIVALRNKALIALFGICAVAFAVVTVFSKTISAPIKRLSRAAAEIGRGNLDLHLEVASRDEIGELTQAFNTMVRDLKESERKCRDLAELLPQVVYELDEHGNVTFANRYGLELFGLSQDDILKGLNALDVFVPEDRQRALVNIRQGLSGRKVENFECTALRKDGSTFPFLTFAVPIDHNGKIIGMRGIGIDITERKQAEEVLRESEVKIRTILEAVQTGIVMIDPETHVIVDANPVAERIIGVAQDLLVGSECHRFICPAERGKCPITDLGQNVDNSERVLITAGGGQRAILKTAVPVILGGKKHLLESFIDITERKLAEEELRESRERFRNLVETTSDWAWEVDAEGRYVYASPRVRDILGYEPEEVFGRTPFDLMPSGEAERIAGIFKNIAMSQRPFSFLENVNLHKNGNKVVLETSGVPIFDSDGTLRGYSGLDRDITQRKKAEEEVLLRSRLVGRLHSALVALAQNEEVYSGAPDAAFRAVTEASAQAMDVRRVSIWFYTAGNAGIQCRDLYDSNSRNHSGGAILETSVYPSYFKAMQEEYCIAADDAITDPRTREFSDAYLKPLGITSMLDVPIRIAGKVIGVVCHEHVGAGRAWTVEEQSFGTAIAGFASMAIEIYERKRAEEKIMELNEELERKVDERSKQLLEAQEELVRKEKLSILGQLAGSVGHELRNPLGVISNAVYFLKTVSPDSDETLKEYLDMIKSEVDNSQRIISDLLDFSRTRTPQPRVISASELITQTLGKCVVPEGVTVDVDIPEALPPVRVDPFQMGQVFQNLITNAVQAMPEGGALRISARKAHGSQLMAHSKTDANRELSAKNCVLEGDSVEISLKDTGQGISPENTKKLFQPLFTTKAKGIGLGLTVCKRLTEANGGRIAFESELGRGTAFTVNLPAG